MTCQPSASASATRSGSSSVVSSGVGAMAPSLRAYVQPVVVGVAEAVARRAGGDGDRGSGGRGDDEARALGAPDGALPPVHGEGDAAALRVGGAVGQVDL